MNQHHSPTALTDEHKGRGRRPLALSPMWTPRGHQSALSTIPHTRRIVPLIPLDHADKFRSMIFGTVWTNTPFRLPAYWPTAQGSTTPTTCMGLSKWPDRSTNGAYHTQGNAMHSGCLAATVTRAATFYRLAQHVRWTWHNRSTLVSPHGVMKLICKVGRQLLYLPVHEGVHSGRAGFSALPGR